MIINEYYQRGVYKSVLLQSVSPTFIKHHQAALTQIFAKTPDTHYLS